MKHILILMLTTMCSLSAQAASEATVTVGGPNVSGYSTTNYDAAPFCTYYANASSMTLYTAEEMGGTSGLIKSIAFYQVSSPTALDSHVTIYMALTDQSKLEGIATTFNDESLTFTKVYDSYGVTIGYTNLANDWHSFAFSTPFEYDANYNLVVAIQRDGNAQNYSTTCFGVNSCAEGKCYLAREDNTTCPLGTSDGLKQTVFPYTKFVIQTCAHPNPEKVSDLVPTCIQKPGAKYHCPDCGEDYEVYSSDTYGYHQFETTTKDATCTEPEYKVMTCTLCNERVVDEASPALGHDYDGDYRCKRCEYRPDVWDAFTIRDTQPYVIQKDSFAIKALTYERTLTNPNVWNPLFVPFTISVNDLKAAGLQAARINAIHVTDTDSDGETDEFYMEVTKIKAATDTLRANTPYVIKAIDNQTGSMPLQLVSHNAKLFPPKMDVYTLSSADADYTIVGNISEKNDLAGSGAYFINEKGELSQTTSADAVLPTHRWSMTVEENNDFGFDVVRKAPRRASQTGIIVDADEYQYGDLCAVTVDVDTPNDPSKSKYAWEWMDHPTYGRACATRNPYPKYGVSELNLDLNLTDDLQYPCTLSFDYAIDCDEFDQFSIYLWVEFNANEIGCTQRGGKRTGHMEYTLQHKNDWGKLRIQARYQDCDYTNNQNECYIYNIKMGTHDYSTVADRIAPKCTETGYVKKECAYCHRHLMFEDEEHPATGHNWDEGLVHSPSCVERGYTSYNCLNDCGTVKKSNYVPANGIHVWTHWKEDEFFCASCPKRSTLFDDADKNGAVSIGDIVRAIDKQDLEGLERVKNTALGVENQQYDVFQSDPVLHDNRIYIVDEKEAKPL